MAEKDRIMIKNDCAKSRKVHKAKLKENLQESIQQAKNGKITSMTFDELKKFVNDKSK